MQTETKISITKMDRNTTPIMGIRVDGNRGEEVLNRAWGLVSGELEASSSLKRSVVRLIVTPNPEIVSRAQSDRELAAILNKADLALADGIGLVFAGWFLNGVSLNRVPGRLLAMHLVKLCAQNKKKVFLLGGKPGAANRAAHELARNFQFPISNFQWNAGPWLNLEGMPVNIKQEKVEQEVLKQINDFKPDLLLVGFGAPKQEKWIWRNREKLGARAAMVVGGMIDYTAGILPAAPGAISGLGLEWLWRSIFEPRRIGRIFTALAVFPLQVISWKIKHG